MGFVKSFLSGLGQSSGPVAITQKSFNAGVSGTIASELFSTSAGALQRGSRELLSTYRNSPHIRKVVGLIANQLAATEFFLTESPESTSSVKSKSLLIRRKIATNGEIITSHPFLDFLYAGNPLMPGVSGMKLSWVYYLLKGEFFWVVVPSSDGSIGWMVIPPTWVESVPTEVGGSFRIRWGSGGSIREVPPEMVLWIKDPDVLNPYGRGAGKGDSLRDESDTDEYAAALMRSTMANKGLMEGVLQVENANRDSLRAMRMEFERNHRGTANSGKVMVVDGNTIKYVPLSHAFSELKLLELREFEKVLVEETFCVPPELFGKVTGSNRATIFEAQNIFANNTLIPNLDLFALEVGLRFLPLFDPTGALELDYVSPAPADKERLLQLISLSPQAFTLNEVRRAADLPETEWGEARIRESPEQEPE